MERTSFGYDFIIQRMRENCIRFITEIYKEKKCQGIIEIDKTEWLKTHCYFAEFNDSYDVAITADKNGNVFLAYHDIYDVFQEMKEEKAPEYYIADTWGFVSLEEMLYIIEQISK